MILRLSALWSCNARSLSLRNHLCNDSCQPRQTKICQRTVCGSCRGPIIKSGLRTFQVIQCEQKPRCIVAQIAEAGITIQAKPTAKFTCCLIVVQRKSFWPRQFTAAFATLGAWACRHWHSNFHPTCLTFRSLSVGAVFPLTVNTRRVERRVISHGCGLCLTPDARVNLWFSP
jgi:hypothetical protein